MCGQSDNVVEIVEASIIAGKAIMLKRCVEAVSKLNQAGMSVDWNSAIVDAVKTLEELKIAI